jgi:IS5 family transposase
MENIKTKRNWSEYNKKLKSCARLELYIHKDIYENWHYVGKRSRGGKLIYADAVIEMCLTVREYFKMALRQSEGFLSSLFQKLNATVKIPDYTTLSRRCKKLKIDFKKNIVRSKNEPLRLAIDSTGLSVMRRTGWHSTKYGGMKQITSQDNWRKIHILVDIDTFDILEAEYTQTNVNDCEMLKPLLDKMDNQISDVYGDLAYDTFLARDTIRKRGARQVIPIKKTAVSSEKRKKKGCLKYPPETYKERDDVIKYLEYNRINGASDLALAHWKRQVGYHKRSLAETQMSRIKAHTTDRLTNIREDNRTVQAMIKVKIVNLINQI